jgi:D-sedoheptulose 7-phosphate isomerase
MNKRNWRSQADEIFSILARMRITDAAGSVMDTDSGYDQWLNWTLDVRNRRGTVYLIGNGASASMASHFSADLAKNGRLHTQVFSDLSLITAISNDMGYEHVFAEPLRRRAHKGDMLVAISSSGSSPNILAAADVTKEMGLTLVTLSGLRDGNPLSSRGQLNLFVSADSYGMTETCHAAALHWWIDLVVQSTPGSE